MQKENTDINRHKNQAEPTVTHAQPYTHTLSVTMCFDYRLQQKHPNEVDSLQ